MIRAIIFSVSSILVLCSCATNPYANMTPLQIQSLQTREFEAKKNIVFPSVISVFQDLGYTINNADMATGLISAESASKSSVGMALLGISKVTQTRATAFVEEIGKKTKARLNFVEINKTSGQYGQNNREDTPILDAKIYENAFEKIKNAIFIRSSN